MNKSYDLSSPDTLQFVVGCKMRQFEQWRDYDQDELECEIHKVFGYHLIDCTGPSRPDDERINIQLCESRSRALRRPMILVHAREQACSITLDMTTMDRDRDVNMGGFTDAEMAAVDALMAKRPGQSRAYRRDLRGPVVRRWSGVPYRWAHSLAVDLFAIVMGER
jgi:hypothetical protein